MARPVRVRLARWTMDHLLWDASGGADEGFRRWLWATRKVLVAVAGAALLTWGEWVEHHPPEIVLAALIHLLFMVIVVALVVFIGERVRHRPGGPLGLDSKGPRE